ncbi:MAG: SLOG family protein [Candidatus Omnitrophota bacterium]
MEKFAPLKLLVCGSRTWTDRARIVATLSAYPPGTAVVHGGNGTVVRGRIVAGADLMAAEVARELGMRTICYNADWAGAGLAAGPARNERMLVREKPSLVIAFVRGPLFKSKGTRDCATRARRHGIRVQIVND